MQEKISHFQHFFHFSPTGGAACVSGGAPPQDFVFGRRKSNLCWFGRADLGQYFVPVLENTGVFPAACASSWPKSAPRKLRSTCELAVFEGFLRPTRAAGLTPSKRGGTKSPEKGRSQAGRGSAPFALGRNAQKGSPELRLPNQSKAYKI